MKRLTFDLKFITPAFIGGAYQQAELRPASFVGLLRWWWRALKGECDIKRLREEEVKIFGGIAKNLKKEEIKMASPVYLRVEGDVSKGEDLINEYRLSWNFDKNRRALIGPHAGVGYLYYSMVALNKREFIKADSRLRLTLIGKDEVLNHYIASLWALVFLGGVGARSRRGGGNLAVVDYNPKDLPKDLEKISFTPTGDFCEWFVKNLKEAKHLVGSSKGSCDKYSNLSNVKLVLSKTEFNTWFEALNDIGKEFMRFRSENKQSVFDTAVFGFSFIRGKGPFVELEEKIKKSEEKIKRRSSPVIIKVVKTPEGKYKWMVLRLRGKFLPDGAKLRFWEETGEPNLGLIEEFFKRLKERQKNE
ncbi:type III-B CRISPR module RAMP protein Cmr1 [Thermocrinis sp.]|uniref:type III-B CRISPR module RAMP protein Cmr1 n=1 Tax=Thermocrinis sp. TaxID=2024383 RepID=UPI003C10C75E